MNTRDGEQKQTCQHESGCRIFTALSFVPAAQKILCVFHKREFQRETGERPRLTQGTQICPHCNESFETRGAVGQRARRYARRTADFSFSRHVDTCRQRQAILKSQNTHTEN